MTLKVLPLRELRLEQASEPLLVVRLARLQVAWVEASFLDLALSEEGWRGQQKVPYGGLREVQQSAVSYRMLTTGVQKMMKNLARKRSSIVSRFVRTQCLTLVGNTYGEAAGAPA